MVDGYGSRIKRESEELRVDGAWHFPICDHNGNIVMYINNPR